MDDVYKIVENFLKLLLSFIIIYIINSYAGYELYTLTLTLISPSLLPSTVWYWIVAKCCFFGLILTLINILAFISLFANIETIIIRKEESSKFHFYYLFQLVSFPKINNTERLLFTKLQNYLFANLDEKEKRLCIKIKRLDSSNEAIYNKILKKHIIKTSDILNVVKFIENIQNKNESFSKKDKKLIDSIIKKLKLMTALNLTEININTLVKCYTKENNIFHDLLDAILCLNNIDARREEVAKFIYNKKIYHSIANPIEKIFKSTNNSYGVGIEIISICSFYALILIIGIWTYAFYANQPWLTATLILGEVIYLITLFYIASVTKPLKSKFILAKMLFYIVTLAICITIPIIKATSFVIDFELKNNHWFYSIHEENLEKSNLLFVDENIINQLKLKRYEMIKNCSTQESTFCYIEAKAINSVNYFQLKNFDKLYMLNLNESSHIYLRDNFGQLFNLGKYGNYYITVIEKLAVSTLKKDDSRKGMVLKSCTAIPSYSTRLSLYSESEFKKKCMYYISGGKVSCIYPFAIDKCN